MQLRSQYGSSVQLRYAKKPGYWATRYRANNDVGAVRAGCNRSCAPFAGSRHQGCCGQTLFLSVHRPSSCVAESAMTEEYPVGHYFKRLLVLQALLGDRRFSHIRICSCHGALSRCGRHQSKWPGGRQLPSILALARAFPSGRRDFRPSYRIRPPLAIASAGRPAGLLLPRLGGCCLWRQPSFSAAANHNPEALACE